MIEAPTATSELRVCGSDCRAWTSWRGSSQDNRVAWKAVCSALLLGYGAWYFSLVADSATLLIIGAVWVIKLVVEIWGQHTPTWACPGSWQLFLVVYALGLPSVVWMFGACRVVDVDFPHRETAGLALYLFGSSYSLGYEVHRFRWKARPENQGKLHTVGLATYCIHPNYFGDLFTYGGWGLACGTQCAMSPALLSLFYLTLFVVPNSDAYLAQKYPDEFPAYLAKTARLIPGVRSKAAAHALAWAGLLVSFYLQINCGPACGM